MPLSNITGKFTGITGSFARDHRQDLWIKKGQLDIEDYDGGMMTLITGEKRKLQKMKNTIKKKRLEAKSKGRKTVKERQIGSQILVRETIRTLGCLRLQRRWSKLIRIF